MSFCFGIFYFFAALVVLLSVNNTFADLVSFGAVATTAKTIANVGSTVAKAVDTASTCIQVWGFFREWSLYFFSPEVPPEFRISYDPVEVKKLRDSPPPRRTVPIEELSVRLEERLQSAASAEDEREIVVI